MEDDPIYDIHSKEYIDDLYISQFREVSLKIIDAFMKCPVPNIPNAFYDLVEAFYYSILRERQSLAHDI
ncbi:hypothetical protein GLOIN_2v1638689 [Rhizophagus irregularis DAOM 181602=DAOM 197198]|nr:hypothetical protein GLOIN_2v1638689 [Rhizophagus irregularis DAOM 181602=DAOM 197198]